MELRIKIEEEKNELDQKIEKLEAFIESESFLNIHEQQRELVKLQVQVMMRYSMVLGKRLLLFTHRGIRQ